MSYIIKGADDKPILHQGKEIHAMDLTGVVKGVDIEKRLLKMVGTDETRDRDGDIVKLSGWMMENYLKNPVFLWAHDYRSVPLAAAQKVIKRRSTNAMEFHLRFPSQELYPFADMILNLYNEGIINASSVGFIPFKWEDLTEEEKQDMSPMAQVWGGKKFTKQELLELSGCAVPSNPNALQNSMAAKGFGDKYKLDLEQISRFIMQSSVHSPIEALGAKSDDVYQELKLDKCAFEDENEPKVHQVPDQVTTEDKPGEIATSDPEVKNLLAEGTEEVTNEEITKPYPNEHACRLANPDNFEKFRRGSREHNGKKYSIIFGKKKGEDSWAEQAYRYNKDTWTASEAGSHCKNHKGSFEAASGASMDEPTAEECVRTFYSEEFGVDVMDADFTLIRIETLDIEGAKTIKTHFKLKDGALFSTKQEVIDSKDLEPDGKAGPVLSRKNRETLTQARDILDEVLKAPLEEPAGGEDPDKTGAGDTTADKALQEELEKIKKIIENINKSFGG